MNSSSQSTESWLPVPGFETYYAASSFGSIKAISRPSVNGFGSTVLKEKILKTHKCKQGYMKVGLRNIGWNRNKSFSVHRIIAITFIPNPDNLPEVNHVNGIKDDNRVENLEWLTESKNTQHAWDTGLCKRRFGKDHWKSKPVIQYSLNLTKIARFSNSREAERNGAGRAKGIHKCCSGNLNKHHGHVWKYE